MQCDASVLFVLIENWLLIGVSDSIECGSFRDCEQQSQGRVSPMLFASLFHAAFSARTKQSVEAQFSTRRFLLLQNKVTFCRAASFIITEPRSSLLRLEKIY